MDIRKGDVVQYFNDTDFFSRLIQLYNRLKFKDIGPTHTGMIITAVGNSVEVYESLASGPVITKMNKSDFAQDLHYRRIALQRQIIPKNYYVGDIDYAIHKYAGSKYGFFDILGIATRFLFGWTPLLVRFFKGDKRLICSELVVRMLYDLNNGKVDFEEEYKIPFDFITPMHIWESEQMQIYDIDEDKWY